MSGWKLNCRTLSKSGSRAFVRLQKCLDCENRIGLGVGQRPSCNGLSGWADRSCFGGLRHGNRSITLLCAHVLLCRAESEPAVEPMARRKEDLLDRLLNNFSLRGTLLHPGTLFVLVTALTIGGALNLWERYQHRLIPRDDYQLTAETVRITPAPAWAKIDLKRLLLEVPAGHEPPSILDTDVVSKTAMTLKSVGWVEEVQQIRKSSEGLQVDLRYRVPVGLVELNRNNVPGLEKAKAAQLMPVDRAGVVMPAQLMEQVDLPKISVFNPHGFNQLTPWVIWPDARVVDAAKIMAAIGSRSKQLGIYRVMTLRSSRQMSATQIPFELWPKKGTKVVWGNAPGKEAVGEADARFKLEALVQFVQQHGTIDQMPERRVDIRSGKIVITQDSHVAKNKDIFSDVK